MWLRENKTFSSAGPFLLFFVCPGKKREERPEGPLLVAMPSRATVFVHYRSFFIT